MEAAFYVCQGVDLGADFLMVSAVDSRSNSPGSSPVCGTALCSWARHFTLIVPLSTQVYKWVLVNLLLGLNLPNGLASHPGRSGNTLLRCYGNRDKLWPDGPLGSYADFTFTFYLEYNLA